MDQINKRQENGRFISIYPVLKSYNSLSPNTELINATATPAVAFC